MLSTRHFSALIPSLLFSTTILAGEGWYVGAGIGYGTTAFDLESNIIQPETNIAPASVTEEKLEDNSAVGDVHGGYQWIFLTQTMTLSLAAEIFAEFQSRDFDLDTTFLDAGNELGYTFNATIDNVYGGSIKPGIFLTNDILVYLNIGAVYMEFQDMESAITGIALPFPAGSFEDKSRAGLRTGVGLQWLLTKQMSLDFSWVRDSFNDFHEKRELSNAESGFGALLDEEIEISSIYNERFMLDFNYYFDFDS